MTNKKHQSAGQNDVFCYLFCLLLTVFYEKIAKIASKRCMVLSFLL